MMNTYWAHSGKLQAQYDEMMNAGFKFTKASERAFHTYYRYFNDGDLPGFARSKWELTKSGRWGRELNARGLEELERRVDEAIEHEWKRYSK
ncbi:MAG: hypothetical protein KBS66_07535 [Eubacterium sp.]|nr:hypothetical protein [Candidatus Colimonas fimequi]